MAKWTEQKIRELFEKINKRYNLNVCPKIKAVDKNWIPVCRKNFDTLVFVPDFLNHKDFSEQARIMSLVIMYSCFYLDKHKNGNLSVQNEFLAKGICKDMGFTYMTYPQIEQQMRNIRPQLYDDNNSSFFKIGDKLRESAFQTYQVVGISRNDNIENLITVKPIGCHLGDPDEVVAESELYERCCKYPDPKDNVVNMRQNLFILCISKDISENEIYSKLKELCPEINKAVPITTRKQRTYEQEGIDAYFLTKDQFAQYQLETCVVEYNISDSGLTGYLYSEIDKYPQDVPLFVVTVANCRRGLLSNYPLAKSIFVQTSSHYDCSEHIINKYKYNKQLGEVMGDFLYEAEQSKYFDFVLNYSDDFECAKQIKELLFQ